MYLHMLLHITLKEAKKSEPKKCFWWLKLFLGLKMDWLLRAKFSNFVYFWNFLACCCFHYLWGVKFSDRWTSWAEMNCSHLTSTAWLSLFHFWHSSSLWWCIVLCNSESFYLCFRIRKSADPFFICPLTLLLPTFLTLPFTNYSTHSNRL